MDETLFRQTEYQTIRKFLRQLDRQEGRTARNLTLALEQELTARQREVIYLYYVRQMTMREIAGLLGLNVSTVSRTCARGRKRLSRCIRYGSGQLLAAALEE